MGLLNRYEKIRMDKDAILKAESRNRSGGKKRMNRTIRVSAAGDILIMKRLLPGYQDVLPIREFLMQGEVRIWKQRYRTAAVTHRRIPAEHG